MKPAATGTRPAAPALRAPPATALPSDPWGAKTCTITVDGRYATDTWVHASSYSAAAYAVVPKVPGGLWYTVTGTGTGFNDAAYYGRQLTLTFSAAGAIARPGDGHGDTRVQDRGDSLWACLSSMRGPIADIGDAVASLDARFAGVTIKAIVSVRMPPE